MKKTPASREKPASRSEGGVEVRRHCDSASVLVDGEPRTPQIETGTKKDAGPRGWRITESGARGGANGCDAQVAGSAPKFLRYIQSRASGSVPVRRFEGIGNVVEVMLAEQNT